MAIMLSSMLLCGGAIVGLSFADRHQPMTVLMETHQSCPTTNLCSYGKRTAVLIQMFTRVPMRIYCCMSPWQCQVYGTFEPNRFCSLIVSTISLGMAPIPICASAVRVWPKERIRRYVRYVPAMRMDPIRTYTKARKLAWQRAASIHLWKYIMWSVTKFVWSAMTCIHLECKMPDFFWVLEPWFFVIIRYLIIFVVFKSTVFVLRYRSQKRIFYF